MMLGRGFWMLLALATVCAIAGCATLQRDMAGVLGGDAAGRGALDEPTVVAGLKEALRVGTQNTVQTTSRVDGFLNGGDSAATDYFRERTRTSLRARFHPIVVQKIQEVGVSRVYGRIADAYNSLPVSGTQRLVDLDEYVTDQALAGLFAVLATEEQRIRQDPLARTTELPRRVFGG